MQISEKSGLLIKDKGELFVDARSIRDKKALITHAHSDHAHVSNTNTYYLTPETASLIKAEKKKAVFKKIPFNKKFNIGDFSCTFHSSGHILGSAQLEVSNSTNAVFTSDFKLQKNILFEGAEILPSEVLVIETTFGRPEFGGDPSKWWRAGFDLMGQAYGGWSHLTGDSDGSPTIIVPFSFI